MSKFQQVIYVRARAHYGRVDFYPACDLSQLFTDISGKKMLSEKVLSLLRSYGFEIKPVELGDDRQGRN